MHGQEVACRAGKGSSGAAVLEGQLVRFITAVHLYAREGWRHISRSGGARAMASAALGWTATDCLLDSFAMAGLWVALAQLSFSFSLGFSYPGLPTGS
jgi:hypothetical protein